MNEEEIVVHVYSGGEFVKAVRIPERDLEKARMKYHRIYNGPVEVRQVA